jgi:TolB-like protein/class 3 adenylate cyclase
MGMERRLAAVLIADVAGYSRLSQADEEGTRALFQADLHEVFEPSIAAHRGRLIKTMGDGVLVEFASVVDALRSAIEIQHAKAVRNSGVSPERRLAFRVGINLGDVIVEGEDIHGDGVNIADRIQALAEPGGVMISGTAYDHMKAKVPVGYADLGPQQVKNIAEPVRIYRVLLDTNDAGKTIAAPAPPRSIRSWRRPAIAATLVVFVGTAGAAAWLRPWESGFQPALPLPDKASVAVLPFTNMSSDPEQGYYADGIADDLITDLSRISGLFVIARNSSFAYKGRNVDVRQVAEELGVRYVLEGSVRRAGKEIRINAQLIDAATGAHKWAERYVGSESDVFVLQDKVVDAVVDALSLRLTGEEQLAISRHDTSVPAAYDAFLRGWEHYRRNTLAEFAKAIHFLEEALRLDPGYLRANGALALIYAHSCYPNPIGMSVTECLTKIHDNLEKAKAQWTSTSHQAAAYLLEFSTKHTSAGRDEALAHLKAAIALEPGDPWSYAYIGWFLSIDGQHTEALQFIDTATRLDPHSPPVFHYFRGFAEFGLQHFEEAAALLENAIRLSPDDMLPYVHLIAAYGYLGRMADAQSAIAKYDALSDALGVPHLNVLHAFWTFPYTVSDDKRRLADGLRKAGVPE